MQINPLVEELGEYPFTELTAKRIALEKSGRTIINFGVGEPREPTPQFIRETLARAVLDEERSQYPSAAGMEQLRESIANWVERRYEVKIDPEIEVIPTFGSKEAIFHLATMLSWADAPRDIVVTTTPGYTVPARSARLAGAKLLELPLDPDSGWLPNIDLIPDEMWSRIAVIWINSPNNPTGAVAPLSFYDDLAERCRRNGVVLASDEAYSEIYFDSPPPSVLEVSDPTHVLAFNSLSKRSAMPGFRSGSVCGDPQLIGAMRDLRPTIGVAPPHFLQVASAAAWDDDSHVDGMRASYRAKRELMLAAFAAAGFPHVGGAASFFLWCDAAGSGEKAADRLLEAGLLVGPGSMFGLGGESFFRAALVPTLDECMIASDALSGLAR